MRIDISTKKIQKWPTTNVLIIMVILNLTTISYHFRSTRWLEHKRKEKEKRGREREKEGRRGERKKKEEEDRKERENNNYCWG
jgi:uncharacterized membrane protein